MRKLTKRRKVILFIELLSLFFVIILINIMKDNFNGYRIHDIAGYTFVQPKMKTYYSFESSSKGIYYYDSNEYKFSYTISKGIVNVEFNDKVQKLYILESGLYDDHHYYYKVSSDVLFEEN